MARSSSYIAGWGTTRPRAALSWPEPSRIRPGMGFARNAEESGRVGGSTWDFGEGLRNMIGDWVWCEGSF